MRNDEFVGGCFAAFQLVCLVGVVLLGCGLACWLLESL